MKDYEIKQALQLGGASQTPSNSNICN